MHCCIDNFHVYSIVHTSVGPFGICWFCLNMTLSRWTVSSIGLKHFVTTQVSIILRKSADTKLTCPVNHEKPIKADTIEGWCEDLELK